MSIRAFYNEIDLYCCAWLSNLMDAGLITPGVICDKSIEDVLPDELFGFDRVHMFAGIGVWDFALNSAGWGSAKVWTGSCPCQPFSAAGAGAGFADPRHLWPTFAWLIKQCRPPVIFGEQVASKAVEPWVDLVHADVEAMGYAFGAVPFPSAGVGAPHIRDRLFWVANSEELRREGQYLRTSRRLQAFGTADYGSTSGMGYTDSKPAGRNPRAAHSTQVEHGPQHGNGNGSGDAGSPLAPDSAPGPVNGFWRSADWLGCRDDKWRPVEPGTFPLAHGLTGRVGRLRAYGNAINAEAARQFILAYLETRP